MLCNHCKTDNPKGAKFCINCGYPLSLICPKCKNKVPDGASFCPYCGQKIGKQHNINPNNANKNSSKNQTFSNNRSTVNVGSTKRELYCPFTKQLFEVDVIPSVCPKCGRTISLFTGQHNEKPIFSQIKTESKPTSQFFTGQHNEKPKSSQIKTESKPTSQFVTQSPQNENEGCKKAIITTLLIIFGIFVIAICLEFGTGASIGGISLYALLLAAVRWYDQKYGKK